MKRPIDTLGSHPVLRRSLVGGLVSVAVATAAAGVASSAAQAATSHNPGGHLDKVVRHADRTVTVSGWEYDPDSSRGTVVITVDGYRHVVAASGIRSDVKRAHRAVPLRTGFSYTSTALRYGSHRVCATAVNRGPGTSTSLGCATVTFIDPHNPRGRAVFGLRGRTVSFHGAVADRDAATGTPLRVQYIVDGRVRKVHTTTTDGRFAGAYALGYGRHTVAVRALNVGAGTASPVIAAKTVTFAPPVPVKNQIINRFALAQVGKAYASGGVGPSAYDCSGLALAAYARAGIRLPHNAQAQYGVVRHITRSQAKPGDLIFFASPGGGIYHVALVAPGSNMMVSAATYGTGVVHKANKYAVQPLSESGWPTSPGSAVRVYFGTLTH